MDFLLTDEERALLPTEDEVESFRERGWYISRPLFTAERLARVVAASERFYTGERDMPMPDGSADYKWTWKPEHGDGLRKSDYSSLQNRELQALVRSPILGAIAAVLTGSDEIRLWHDQLLYKPVDSGERNNSVGWHTDRGYWKTCSSSAMLTAWVPFHDCDATMGTVSMIDGSNHWPDNTEKLNFFDPNLEALERQFITGGKPVVKVPMELRAGQVSFHSCLTIHGSGQNRSHRPRRSIAIHMQDASNRWQEYRHADGKLATHANDDFARKLDGNPDYSDPAICPVLWSGAVGWGTTAPQHRALRCPPGSRTAEV